jgi:hypothetical protein
MADTNESFLTSLHEFDNIKNSYISLKLNKNLENIEENYHKLGSAINAYPNQMDRLLQGHQQDFYKAYKVHASAGANGQAQKGARAVQAKVSHAERSIQQKQRIHNPAVAAQVVRQ